MYFKLRFGLVNTIDTYLRKNPSLALNKLDLIRYQIWDWFFFFKKSIKLAFKTGFVSTHRLFFFVKENLYLLLVLKFLVYKCKNINWNFMLHFKVFFWLGKYYTYKLQINCNIMNASNLRASWALNEVPSMRANKLFLNPMAWVIGS